MNQVTISAISTFINLLLTTTKFLAGIFTGSIALIAEAIHSGLDVFSSAITWFGTKSAQKPVDKEHPYGYYRAESIAGFVVVALLVISAGWILYEGITSLINPEPVSWSFWALIVMGASVIINEIMARIKFHYGNKFSSLALIADAQHSRADVVASLGVFVGLIIIKFFVNADAIIALLVGGYILWESWGLGKEVTDSLLDVANPELEKKIKDVVKEKGISVSEIKTRKIGSTNFAEIKINLDPRQKVNEVEKISSDLEKSLINKIPELRQITISVGSHDYSKTAVAPRFGGKFVTRRGFEPLGPSKRGKRTIIPVEKDEISERFGASEYLLIDKDKEGKILLREKIKNPYWGQDGGHGFKFAKAVSADVICAKNVGENARKNMQAYGIKLEIIPSGKKLKDIS